MPKIPKPLSREDLLIKIKMLKQDCDEESLKRMDIERSKDFQAAQVDIEATEATVRDLISEITAIKERQKEMLAVVSDARPALEEAKRLLIEVMKLEGVDGYTEDWISAVGKFSEKKTVDGMRLMKVLGGDIEEFVRIVKPTQKAVKEYAMEHEDIKKQLFACIKLESRELVDVDIQIPDAA